MFERLKANDTPLYIIAGILLLPALLINLGNLPFFIADDEATRALVALEMIIRDNYAYSTLNGDFYLYKPPLFNWFVAAFYNIFGSYSEFVSRLPNVIGLLLFGLSIFLSMKHYYTKKQAALIAFAFITSGRILFWESFMCLIDISFSAVEFTMFMVVFYYGERQKFYKMFIYAYILTAIAFMMKGLPALVFLGITLLVYFIYRYRLIALIRFSHVLGFLVFSLIVGAYYYNYWRFNPDTLVFEKLWNESTGRFTDYSILDYIRRIFEFPLELFYHFLPWTILVIFILKRGLYYEFYDNKIINFCILIFFFNVIPYWTAPGFYPRYILMLVPLIYIVLFDFYFRYSEKFYKRTTAMDYVLGLSMVGVSILYISLPTFDKTSHYPFIWFVSIFFFFLTGAILFTFIRLPKSRLIIFVIALLTFRIIFGLYLWPLRGESVEQYKVDADMIAELTTDEEVEILFWKNLHHGLSFYLTREKWQIVKMNRLGKEIQTNKFYLIDERSLGEMLKGGFAYDEYMKFKPMDEWRNIYLIKFTTMGDLPENIYIKN